MPSVPGLDVLEGARLALADACMCVFVPDVLDAYACGAQGLAREERSVHVRVSDLLATDADEGERTPS